MAHHVKFSLALLGLVIWMVAWEAPALAAQAKCGDVAERGTLKVLSINLLATEIIDRDRRLKRIANFAVKREVDVILLQEVVGGSLFETDNSARDLRKFLKERGRRYNLRTALEAGLPSQAFLGNAILSRCEILRDQVHFLPLTDEIDIFGLDIVFPRNAMMSRIRVPDFGRLNVYNTHLCARCNDSELAEQTDSLLDFVQEVENALPRRTPVVLGGDFNINRFGDDDKQARIYDGILAAGYRDAYVRAKKLPLDELCNPAQTAYPDEHCTIGEGVTALSTSAPGRIDYVFERGFPRVRRSSQVVFNPLVVERTGVGGKTVSDHAGLFILLKLSK